MARNPFSDGISVPIDADTSGFNNAIGGAIAVIGRFTGALGLIGGAVGVAAAAVGARGVRAFADFDAAMTESLAIMGEVSSEMEQGMSAAAQEVARTTTFSANQAAESYFFLASAGLEAKESIEALPVVAQFAQAGMFSMSKATDLLTDAQSALGKTMEDPIENMEEMTELSDILVNANQQANASVQQFAEALTSDAAAAMKAFNIETEEGVAVLASLADQGVKGAKAGTSLSRVINRLPKMARENADAFEEMGVRVFDASGEMRNLGTIIGEMEEGLEGMSSEQQSAALQSLGFTRRMQRTALQLLGTSEQIKEYEANLRSAGGATEDVAENQLDTINRQWELFTSKMNTVALGIGNFLMPAVEFAMAGLNALADVLVDLAAELGRVGRGIDDAVEGFTEYVNEAAEARSASADTGQELGHLEDRADDAAAAYDETTQAGQSFTAQSAQVVDASSEMGQQYADLASTMREDYLEASEGATTAMMQQQAAAEEAAKAQKEMRKEFLNADTVDAVTDALLRMEGSAAGLEQLSSSARQLRRDWISQNDELQRMQEQLRQTESMLSNVGGAHDELGDNIADTRIRIEEIRLSAREEGRDLTESEKAQLEDLQTQNDRLQLIQMKLRDSTERLTDAERARIRELTGFNIEETVSDMDTLKEKRDEQTRAIKSQKQELSETRSQFRNLILELSRADPEAFLSLMGDMTTSVEGFKDQLFALTGASTLAALDKLAAKLQLVADAANSIPDEFGPTGGGGGGGPNPFGGTAGPNRKLGGPTSRTGFQSGGLVTRTGMALVHAGERVIPSAGKSQGASRNVFHITVHAQDGRDAGQQIRRELESFNI